MQKSKRLFRMTVCAMFTAIAVVIGTVCKEFLTFGAVRITFENLTVLLSGILFGPLYGAAVGVCTDLITCFTAAQPSVNPLITLGACSVGLISGLAGRVARGRLTLARLALCVFPAHAVGNMLIKSLALHVYYAYPIELLLLRVPTYIFIGTCECIFISAILKNKYIRTQTEGLR